MGQYSNMDSRLSGQKSKFLKFLLSRNSKRDFKTKKTTPNIEVCPESLVAMSEYWYIERGRLFRHPRERAQIAWQIGALRTNHDREFCYRYD